MSGGASAPPVPLQPGLERAGLARHGMTLRFENVVKTVGRETHIHETSLELYREGFNTLLGTTLAGKTTLIQLMAGLEKPTSGRVFFDGKDVTRRRPQKRNVAMVHQQFINYPTMSVFDNIASPLRVLRMKSAEIKRRVGEAAELMRLTPYLDRKPSELSGGQQQRTALARSIVKDADLVLLDEPLANLDYKLREELRDELPKLFAGRGAIVVYATTEPTEALLLGGHTAALHEGRVTQYGLTGDVYRKPADLLTAQVFSDPPMNTVQTIKDGDMIRLAERRRLPRPRPDRRRAWPGVYTLAIRPNHVTPGPAGSTPVRVGGRVQVTELSGSPRASRISGSRRALMGERRATACIRSASASRTSSIFDAAQCLYFDGWRAAVCARGLRETPMARITLDKLRHSYMAKPKSEADYALKGDRPRMVRRRRLRAARPLRLRKDDAPQHHLGPDARPARAASSSAMTGRDAPARPTERNIAQVFQFPVIYDTMTVYDNLAFPLKNRGDGRDDHRPARSRDRRDAGAVRYSRPARERPHGGWQAEDLARPRAGARRRQRHHVRRAADGDRPASEMAAPLQAQGAASAAPQAHDDLRDPRPDRGADLRRSGGRDAGRAGGADRHPGGSLRARPAIPSSAISSARRA